MGEVGIELPFDQSRRIWLNFCQGLFFGQGCHIAIRGDLDEEIKIRDFGVFSFLCMLIRLACDEVVGASTGNMLRCGIVNASLPV